MTYLLSLIDASHVYMHFIWQFITDHLLPTQWTVSAALSKPSFDAFRAEAMLASQLRHQITLVIFLKTNQTLVSTDITGSGEFEIDTDELLAEIDQLNPRNRNGQRPVRIRCLQLLDPDPLGTLKRIAEEHGGPGGYAFIDRNQIGLDSSK